MSSYVIVHIRDKCFRVPIGSGEQPVKWLAHAACIRCDPRPGAIRVSGLREENGRSIPNDARVIDAIPLGTDVWAVEVVTVVASPTPSRPPEMTNEGWRAMATPSPR
mmetsp:Transcript_49693/g.108520  ORF Transcript_49693/g.108520 Transcript_49693/m.108520 type:complete len:107 (-) Transcript_49693:101-421(-)